MAKKETFHTTYADLISGDKLFLQRARTALPYLVRQARAGKPIYYSDLASEIGVPNPRNLNYPLGAIGNALISLGEKMKLEIPPIQCLVINKATGLPGEGIEWFMDQREFKKLNKAKKKEVLDIQLSKIYTFPHWKQVLSALEIKEVNNDLRQLIEKARYASFGGGESEHHKNFKHALAQNPFLLGLEVAQGQTEYRLPSADSIDVLFINKTELIAVEVKSAISADEDILRGLFQCVKYKYLIQAEQIVKNLQPDTRVILALQGKFPSKLLSVKNSLGIEVIDQIQIP